MQSIVTASGVSFEVSNGRQLFSNLNFTLDSKVTALVGPNGVGKSTLAKLLAQELEPTEGTIRKNAAITFFPQKLAAPVATVNEYLALEYTWSPLGEKLLANINRESLCTDLSGGQWMRVRLTKALNEQYLILDEPTNDLDRDGRSALVQYLREFEGGVLLISHDRECLELCAEILELSNRGITKFGHGWKFYEEFKNKERENLGHLLEVAKRDRDTAFSERHNEIAKQEKRNRRGLEAAARGGMPKILMGARKRKAQTTTGKIDAATLERSNNAVTKAFEALTDLKIDPLMYAEIQGQAIPAQKLVAEASEFNICYQDWIFKKDLTFNWRGNIRVAIKGPNGSGKSSLLKAILGAKVKTRGELRSGNLITLYLDQQCSILDTTKSILENIRNASNADETEIRNGLAKFLFTKDKVFQKVNTLSGGETLRAALAMGLLGAKKPELLILDEPTNNLDLTNIRFLENLVSEFRGALIMISHDEIFLKNCQIQEELNIDC